MKKIAFALLAIVGFTTANAQDHSILLYGNAGVNSKTDDTKTNSLSWHVNPGVGYQIDKHWTAGIELGWGQASSKPSGGDRATDNLYNVGLFGRYTHHFGNSHFFCYEQVGVGYQGQYSTEGSAPATNKESGIAAYLTPNVGYAFGRGYAIYASIGGISYSTLKPSDATIANPDKNPTNEFNFTFGNDFQFGVSKNFSCHHMHHHHDANAEMRKVDNSGDDEDGDKPMKKEKHHHHKDSDNDKDDE